jgi:hypothetical protein
VFRFLSVSRHFVKRLFAPEFSDTYFINLTAEESKWWTARFLDHSSKPDAEYYLKCDNNLLKSTRVTVQHNKLKSLPLRAVWYVKTLALRWLSIVHANISYQLLSEYCTFLPESISDSRQFYSSKFIDYTIIYSFLPCSGSSPINLSTLYLSSAYLRSYNSSLLAYCYVQLLPVTMLDFIQLPISICLFIIN